MSSTSGTGLGVISIFYRCGSLVFGGGPVVVPILLNELEPSGLLSPRQFLLGFGAVNILPGPLFNVAAFCGGIIGGVGGAFACWCAMMLPGIVMAVGALPIWSSIRNNHAMNAFLAGVNASASGLMTAAFVGLWLTLVVDANTSETVGAVALPSSAKAATILAFVSIQAIFKVKSHWVVFLGALFGLAAVL